MLSLPANTEPFIVRPVTQSAVTTALAAAHVTAEALNLAVLRITALGGARTRLALHDALRPSSGAIGGRLLFARDWAPTMLAVFFDDDRSLL